MFANRWEGLTLDNNTIILSGQSQGIFFGVNVHNNTIHNNHIMQGAAGVMITAGYNNRLINNTISHSGTAISMGGGDHNYIIRNLLLSNTKGIEGGKNAFTFAVLGIVVALASFLILRFISTFTGVTSILQFNTQLP